MIQIFYTYIVKENHSLLIEKLLPNFSINFQNKILRYRKWEDAQLSLLGRMLLSKGLQNFNKKLRLEDLCYTKHSKPYFENENVKFNISHSGNIVICAMTEFCEIGIDIEQLNEIKIKDFESQMTQNEINKINNSKDNQISFFNYWTQKEAVIKAHGMGLSIPLKSFEIENEQTIINHKKFFLKELKLDKNYICHLALSDEEKLLNTVPKIVICDFSVAN